MFLQPGGVESHDEPGSFSMIAATASPGLTAVVSTIQKGGSLAALKKMLGHDRLSTTEIYLNLSPEQVLDEFHSKW